MVEVTINSDVVAVARTEAAQAGKRLYGAERAYASLLNQAFGIQAIYGPNRDQYWWDVKADSRESNDKIVVDEFKAYYAELREADQKNPSVNGGRVRKYGYEESGLKPASTEGAEGAEGEGAEGEGSGSRARPLALRYTEDLGALYKARFNEKYQSEITDKIRQAHKHIEQALLSLGVDLTELVK